MPNRLHILALLAGTMGLVAAVDAHPISLSATVADVRKERITAEIEIMLQELVLCDALATSVSGDLLGQLYLQIKRSLRMAEQGGALSRVGHVEVVALRTQRRAGAKETRYRCT